MHIISDYIGIEDAIFNTQTGGNMDYSESIIYLRTFITRCENALLKRDLDLASKEAEHVMAEARQLVSTLEKMKELV